MIHRLRSKLTYANVVASLALFIALGGSAYAIGTGAIGSREIRDDSIRSRDVRRNTLIGSDINERSLRTSPRVYRRQGGGMVRLSALQQAQTVSCDRGDTAISGTQGAGGNQSGFRTSGAFAGAGDRPSGYTGLITGEPSSYGEQRFLQVVVICLAKARR